MDRFWEPFWSILGAILAHFGSHFGMNFGIREKLIFDDPSMQFQWLWDDFGHHFGSQNALKFGSIFRSIFQWIVDLISDDFGAIWNQKGPKNL